MYLAFWDVVFVCVENDVYEDGTHHHRRRRRVIKLVFSHSSTHCFPISFNVVV